MKNLLTYYSILYLLLILFLTISFQSFTGWMFMIYAVLALPFLKDLTKYLCICLVVSTTAYYYRGCDEQIYSIYSILSLLSLLSPKKSCSIGKVKRIVPFILLLIVACISFDYSSFLYYNGLFELLYIILIAIVIILCIDIDYKELYEFLPVLSVVMISFIALKMGLGGMNSNGRFSIDPSVDANTAGSACAIFATIFSMVLLIKKCAHTKIYLIGCIMAVIALLLTGSRSALIGYLGSCLMIYCLISYRQHKIAKRVFNLILSLLLIIIIGIPILEQYIDFQRFLDVDGIVQSGGTHRTQIYDLIIEYTLDNNYIWGYGPGHVCSSYVVSKLMGRNLAHTHNIFIESFGEMGFCGLIIFTVIVLMILITILRSSKNNQYLYLPFGLFLCIIINGMGESFLCDIVFWIISALCVGSIKYTRKILVR